MLPSVADLFLHQGVRDLNWLITSPDLFPAMPGLILPPRAWRDRMIAQSLPWLRQLDDNPADLQAWLGEAWAETNKGARLGIHAERLIEFWLASQPNLKVRAAHLTVTGAERVLGDLDVVFSDASRPEWVHWEIAVKFYLRAEHGDGFEQWIGPNPRDRLDQKLEKIVAQQLPLGSLPETRQALAGIGDTPIVSEAFVKGWMFHRFDEGDAAGVPGLAQDHLRGWWMRHGEADVPVAGRSSRFLFVPRWEWMSPVHRPGDSVRDALSPRQLNDHLHRHFQKAKSPLLIAEMQLDLHGWWKELSRGFVVHPEWPALP